MITFGLCDDCKKYQANVILNGRALCLACYRLSIKRLKEVTAKAFNFKN